MAYAQYIKGKAIQTGCEWRMKIQISSPDLEVFEPTATFLAHVRESTDGALLAVLSTANGNIERVDGKTIEVSIPGDVSSNWTVSKAVLDILRTDGGENIHLGFDLEIPVKRTITRP